MRFLTALALLVLLHLYVALRVLGDLPGTAAGWALGVPFALALAAAVPLFVGAWRARGGRLGTALHWAGMVGAGWASSALLLTLLRDLGLLMVAAAHALGAPATPEALPGQTAMGVVAGSVLLTLAGFVGARRMDRVVTVDIPIANLPPALHGFTIAQVSDVHVGRTIRRPQVESIVAAVNALDADVVAITGDLVDGSVAELRAHVAPLAQLKARHGTCFVTGNHEYYSGVHGWVAELRRLGLTVLLNEHVVLDHGGARLVLAGITDFTAGHFDRAHRSDPHGALRGAPPDAAVRVLLAHQPRSAAQAAGAGYDLQLSGHTHGGQFLPWNFFVTIQQPVVAGLHRLHGGWVYTSRGTGYWGPPKRLGAPSEITRVRLVPAGGDAGTAHATRTRPRPWMAAPPAPMRPQR